MVALDDIVHRDKQELWKAVLILLFTKAAAMADMTLPSIEESCFVLWCILYRLKLFKKYHLEFDEMIGLWVLF